MSWPLAPGPCAPGRHVLATESLLLYTPRTQLDAVAAIASGADPEALRWLGLQTDRLFPDADTRRAILRMNPLADPRRRIPRPLTQPFEPDPEDPEFLVCVLRDDGRYAGALQLEQHKGHIGGWLAPGLRGQGLGAQLFGAGALLAHTHFGMDTVRAGAETGNLASRRSLERAGFVPDEGPARHTLPDGREIDSVWLRHDVSPASYCH
ncbi:MULTISPECIES: GNAT family N-acetyltransferase [Streptomyces]|uniref:GNAT family N-acetyltransferase n=1 Tax=Streptomyces TaxID=1883 RepID=UPI00292CB0D1|nr:GNAT family protein [Streptomyces sp. NEAU-HV9]